MRKKRHAQANVTQSFGHRGDKQEVCSLQGLPFHYECVRGAKLFCHVCQRRTLVQRSDQQFSKNVPLTCVIAFVCLHAGSIVLGKSHPNAASYPFLILAPTLSCAGNLYRGITTTGRARTGWLLFASALLLWMRVFRFLAGKMWLITFLKLPHGSPISVTSCTEHLSL